MSFCDVLGPYLVKVAVDRYLAPVKGATSGLWSWPQPATAARDRTNFHNYFSLLILTFVFEFLQTYFMQWTGQKVMFDLRSQIFRHLQRMHVAFYDKNPVGRLVTRVTTDVDALNEMFTSGVVSIFEDFFVLVGILGIMLCMNWKLALITFAVLPFIVVATKIFRDKVRVLTGRIRTAIARIKLLSAGARQRHGRAAAFQRERKAYQRFSEINRSHMDAFQRRDPGLCRLLPGRRLLFRDRDCQRDLVRRAGCDARPGRQQRFRRVPPPVARVISPVATAASLGVLIAFTQYAMRFSAPSWTSSEKYNISSPQWPPANEFSNCWIRRSTLCHPPSRGP